MALEDAQKWVSNECELGHISSIKLLPGKNYNNLNEKFEWANIPMFAVITGRNGVGKTSLLEAIRESLLEKNNENKFSKRFAIQANCMPQFFCSMDNESDDLHQTDEFDQKLKEESIAFADYCVEKMLSKHDNIELPNESLRDAFDSACETFDFAKKCLTSESYLKWIAAELKNHWINTSRKSHLSNFGTLHAIISRLHYIRCNWDKLNNFLSENGFKYHIVVTQNVAAMPVNPAVLASLFNVEDIVTKQQAEYCFVKPSEQYSLPIPVTKLSPGEEIQLVMLLWRYDKGFTGRAKENGIMLLDEPDAHLHPSLVSDLINAYRNEFVSKQGVQIILTTHNPTTVSMVNKENIFIMSEDNGQATIKPATSKEKALRCLLPPHIGVHDRTRVVFVDSDEDEIFFDVAYQVFQRMTNPKISYRLLFTPLCPSGITTGARVAEFVNRLTHEETSQTFSDCVFGIAVATSTNHSREKSNVFHLDRCNVLSFIYDPVHLYFVFEHLAEKGRLKQLDLWCTIQGAIQANHSNKDIISLLCDHPERHVEVLQLIVDEMSRLLNTVVSQMASKEKCKFDAVSKLHKHITEAEIVKIEFRNSTSELFQLEYRAFWLSSSDDISELIFDQFIKGDSCCKSKEEFTIDIIKYCRDQVQPSMMFPAELGNIFNTIQGEQTETN
jgi:ABC-type cobalamin/Fe3+-siderophores transport system ATPase subunit